MPKRCERGKHRWSGPTMMLAGGIGLRCFRCDTWVTYDDLFAAVGTTAYDAMNTLEAEWERQERCAEVADAMERSQL